MGTWVSERGGKSVSTGWGIRVSISPSLGLALPEASFCAGDGQKSALVTVASSQSLVLLFG